MRTDFLLLLVLAVLFAGFVGLLQGFYWLSRSREEASDAFLKRRLGLSHGERQEDDLEADLLRKQAVDSATEALGSYGRVLEETIRAANSTLTVSSLVGRMVMFGLIGAAVGWAMAGTSASSLGLITFLLPFLLLKRTAIQRAKNLRSQMPDALEMMGRSMQAGIGLSEAFKMAADEMEDPISMEWSRVYEEVRFGKDWRDALGGLVLRNPGLFELRLLVSSVLLQRDTGGNIIETFENIAKTIRQRYVFDAKVAAMTSEARTSGIVLAGMPLGIVVLIMLASPDYLMPLVEESTGHMVVIYCVASYLFGLYIMKIQSTVEV